MNEHTDDTMTTEALRDLDPAPRADLTEAERARADATFARIVATPGEGHVPEEADRPRRRRRRLLVPVGLVGAAGAAVPALLLGGGSAFASWTPKPGPLTAAAVSEAATTCRAALGVPDRGERVVIAERRGEWTYVLIAGPQAEGACLMPDHLVGRQDPADHTKKGFFGGYTTDPVEAPTVARDRIVETENMAGSVPTGVSGLPSRRWVVQLGPGLCRQGRHRCHRAHPRGDRRPGFRRPWALCRLVAVRPT